MTDPGLRGNRNFTLLWSGNAVSLIGFHGTRIAVPLLVLAITNSPTIAGWAGFALSAPSLIFQAAAGVVADRYDRIRVLRVCQLVGLLSACVVTAAVVADPQGLALMIIVAAFIEGTVYVFIETCEVGAVRDVVPESHRPAAFSLLESEQPVALLIGRAAGGAIYGLARWLPFAVDAASYLYCLVTLSLIRREQPAKPVAPRARPSVRDIAAGARVVWNEPLLRLSTTVAALSNMIIQIVLLLILFEMTHDGRPAWAAGVVLAAAGVGGILGAVVAARITTRFPAALIYRTGLWVWTALLIPIAVSNNPFVLALCWGGIGGVGVAASVALTIYQVEVIPEEVFGRAVAAMGLMTNGAAALGALAAGYLLSLLGPGPTRWISLALMCALAGIVNVSRSARPTALRSASYGAPLE